jgi:hypothetical protein
MRRLAAVIEAEISAARFAAKGQEVELVAEGHLAMRPDGFDVGGRHAGVRCAALFAV